MKPAPPVMKTLMPRSSRRIAGRLGRGIVLIRGGGASVSRRRAPAAGERTTSR